MVIEGGESESPALLSLRRVAGLAGKRWPGRGYVVSSSETARAVVEIPELTFLRRGKVRDVFDLGDDSC